MPCLALNTVNLRGAAYPLQRLPLSVARLVDQSPLSTPDGSLLLGSQHTSVFLLDAHTGQLLRQGAADSFQEGRLHPIVHLC